MKRNNLQIQRVGYSIRQWPRLQKNAKAEKQIKVEGLS